MDDTPLPDLLSNRRRPDESDDTAGPPSGSTLTFDEAVAMHSDLTQVWAEAKASFNAMAEANNRISSAASQGLSIPPSEGERLNIFNIQFARQLDRVMSMLDAEKDQVRLELLRGMYQNLSPFWAQLVMQTHMGRVAIRSPGKIHEILLGEATQLLDRARSRG